MLNVPKVAIIGGTPPTVMINPLKLPNTMPRAKPNSTASTIDISGFTLTTKATIIATRPIIDPTDRSMPRVMMTIVWARATMARMEIFSRMSRKFSRLKK